MKTLIELMEELKANRHPSYVLGVKDATSILQTFAQSPETVEVIAIDICAIECGKFTNALNKWEALAEIEKQRFRAQAKAALSVLGVEK